MSEISITRTIYEYFDDIEETEIRQNIIMYMEKYNIGNKGISTKIKHKLKFKNQIGGLVVLRPQTGSASKTYKY